MPRLLSTLVATTAAVSTLAFGVTSAPSVVSSSDEGEVYAETVTSLTGDVEIGLTIYRPAGASSENPVPVLLNSHGWGGSRTKGATSFGSEQEAGFGLVTIDMRGHGSSTGQAAGMDPELEGQDLVAVVDHIASLDWVLQDELEDDSPWADDARGGDPVMGSFGGSYGGAFQFTLAMTELRDFGATRMDAMAPDMTWNNLNQSFGPNKVPRTVWLSALLGLGFAAVDMDPIIPEAYAFASATGQYPDGTVPGVYNVYERFTTHGPSGYRDADGQQIVLDVPMLITQGFSDNLFPFNEAWRNWTEVLTPAAREQSHLVGYNGGHALPNVAPLGYASGGDKCGGTSTATRVKFFTAALLTDGDTRVLGSEPFHHTTASGECIHLDESDIDYTVAYAPLELDPTGTTGPATGNTTMAGVPISLPLAVGPLTIAGVPTLTADVYGLGYDQRVFFALAKGTSQANAQVIQNNVQPYRMVGPVPSLGERITLPLVGVAETLDEGETLYLMISPTSDMFAAHGSRTPGAIGFANVEVIIPTVVS